MATYSAQCSAVGSFEHADNFKLYVVLTNRDGNPVTNKSYVDYNVYCQASGYGSIKAKHQLYFWIAGSLIRNEIVNVNVLSPNAYIGIASGSIEVEHESDGKKSIIFEAIISASNYGVYAKINENFELTTIPRASGVSGGSGNIGGKTTISVSRASTSFTHTLRYAFGSLSGTIATGVGTSHNWTIPTSFYAQIPSNPNGVGTIYCDTYSGSTLVGTKTTSFTATADKETCKPTVSATIKDTNSTTIALTGNANKLIRYKSTAQLVITSTPKNSAKIKSVTVNGATVGTSNSITLNYSNVSTDNFAIIATDTREYPSSTVTVSPSYVDYVPLTVNANFFRPRPTDSEIQLTYSGKYFNGSFGQVHNELAITWDYKEKNSSEWIWGGVWLTPNIEGNTITQQTISLGTNFDYQKDYNFRLYVRDKLNDYHIYQDVSVGMPVFYWGKDFFNVTVPINGVDITKLSVDKNFDSGDLNNLPYYGTGFFRCRYGCTNTPNNSGVENVHWYVLQNVWAAGAYANQIATPVHGDLRLYFRTCVNGNWSAWKTIQEAPVSLYDNTSGTSGTITLSETSDNFNYLEVFYGKSTDFMGSIKIIPSLIKTGCMSYSYEDGTILQKGTTTIKVSGNNITVDTTTSGGANFYLTSGNVEVITNEIKIYKVVGYR